MRLPRRSLRSIPALPSIYTSFPVDSNPSSRDTSANETIDGTDVEEGIEVVPIERSNTICGKILSPGTEEKEVVFKTKSADLSSKRLPDLPKNRWMKSPKSSWDRLPVKHRIVVLFALQIGILLIITGCLLSLKKRNAHSHKSTVQPTDPEAPPVTPSIPIKQGIFAVALGNPRQQSSACLARNNESAAWACTSDDILQFDILPPATETPGQKLISIGPASSFNQTSYGQRSLVITPVILTPTRDPEFPDNGLAYHFQTTYNRTVLIKDDQMPVTSMASGRLGMGSSTVREGDQPWLCFFNETVVEGFIYVSRRSVSTNISTNSISPSSAKASETPFLPYTFKLSEQRVTGSTMPYCERQTVLEDGKLVSNGTSILLLTLSEPAFALGGFTMHRYIRTSYEKRQQTSSVKSCQCQWVVQ